MYDYFMKRMIYQKFILGTGNKLDKALLQGFGGVIFFTKDIQNEEQFKNLILDIKNKALIPPFLSIDQEGGRVERTENLKSKRLSARYAFEKGDKFLKEQSEEISSELKNWGLNLNFAPCVDVNTNPNNPIIGERAFANNTDDVIKGEEIFIEASRKNCIIPCVKHFPGHGDADKDSHLDLPKIDLSLTEMEKVHIKPFKYAIENNIEMIMVAHLHCTCFDKESLPTSLSPNAIGYLRNQLGYNGVLITDDMVMKAVQDFGSLEACIMAIKAGVDMFIFREADDKTLRIIEDLALAVEKDDELKTKIIESNERILKLKKLYGIL